MTCGGCVASVAEKLLKIPGVKKVEVSLERGEAEVQMQNQVSLSDLNAALPDKYRILVKDENGISSSPQKTKSKIHQLQPLFLIFAYLFGAALLLNYKTWDTTEAMLDFMGLFYIVFSFFKFLDLKGFPESFRMYDPLARAVPIYGWAYPFLELVLGLMFLLRFNIEAALVTTILVLGITTFGVTKTLLDKKAMQCACLGTALKLPMTEATFIENAIMLAMAVTLLTQYL